MWQDDFSKKVVYSTATDYCRHLSLGNYRDWYLPSLEELKTIVDYDRTGPAISPIFKTIYSSKYWSSTGYYIDFSDGRAGSYNRRGIYVRCVREIGE